MTFYANPSPTYQPAMRLIAAITNAYPALVTTTFDHDYNDGLIVRLIIPQGWGMVQANQLTGAIIVTGPTTFTVDIDTRSFDAFVVVPPGFLNPMAAQVIPVGEINSTLASATVNVLPYNQ